MNRLFNTIIISAFVALMAACAPESSRLPEKPSLKASTDILLFSEAGGSETVSFTTNRPWTAELLSSEVDASEQWCTISKLNGAEGENSITVNVAALNGDYREVILLLNASASGCEIVVKQSGQPVIVTNDASDITESCAIITGHWNYSGDLEVVETGVMLESAGGSPEYLPSQSEDANSIIVEISDLMPETTYKYSVYVLAADGRRYVGEQKEFTTEAEPVLESIADLKAAGYAIAAGGQKNLVESKFIEGIVIKVSDVVLLQDDIKKHSGITLTISEGVNLTEGDRIKIRTKGTVLSHSDNNLVTFAVPGKNVTVEASGQSVGYAQASHMELSDYEAMQVEIANTQLTKLFTDISAYPTWKSAPIWSFEVNGSDQSYNVAVPENATIASETPVSKSGIIKGIAGYFDDIRTTVIICSEPEHIAGLSNERFESLLEFSYTAPYFAGNLNAEEGSYGKVVLPYKNGDNSTIEGPVSVTISAEDESILGTLTVEVLENIKIGTGLGQIEFKVSGTPAAAGTVTFTINGIPGLKENTCTAVIAAPVLPVVGNYEVIWNTNTSKGATNAVVDKNNPDATASDLVINASADNITGTKWAELGAIGWDANTAENFISNPVQYYQFTITVASGKSLSLSGMDITQRINGGDVTLSVQYSTDGTKFTEINSYLLTSTVSDVVVNLGKVSALTDIPEGTVVTFRLVPIATNAKTKWGIKVGSRFAVYGNVE